MWGLVSSLILVMQAGVTLSSGTNDGFYLRCQMAWFCQSALLAAEPDASCLPLRALLQLKTAVLSEGCWEESIWEGPYVEHSIMSSWGGWLQVRKDLTPGWALLDLESSYLSLLCTKTFGFWPTKMSKKISPIFFFLEKFYMQVWEILPLSRHIFKESLNP
jgi:hypothetical protein